MTEPVELRTARLPLEPYELKDVDDVFTYASDPNWAGYLSVPTHTLRPHAAEFVAGSVLTPWNTTPDQKGNRFGGFRLLASLGSATDREAILGGDELMASVTPARELAPVTGPLSSVYHSGLII